MRDELKLLVMFMVVLSFAAAAVAGGYQYAARSPVQSQIAETLPTIGGSSGEEAAHGNYADREAGCADLCRLTWYNINEDQYLACRHDCSDSVMISSHRKCG